MILNGQFERLDLLAIGSGRLILEDPGGTPLDVLLGDHSAAPTSQPGGVLIESPSKRAGVSAKGEGVEITFFLRIGISLAKAIGFFWVKCGRGVDRLTAAKQISPRVDVKRRLSPFLRSEEIRTGVFACMAAHLNELEL